MQTDKEKLSYTMGQQIGAGIKQDKLDVDTDTLVLGLSHQLNGEESLLSGEEMRAVIEDFQKQMQSQASGVQQKNAETGAQFLADNVNNEGVQVLSSGMQYIVLAEGEGEKPAATDTVNVHYEGSLINGTVFDSSIKRGEPATFPVNGVIQGWQEALQLMNVGAKWKVFIPSNLAYGENGAGGSIGPNETLIFEMELLAINN
ncbi:MAG: FKBP-type peptidyl-prolyl cis-trans isomerase [Cycloclasticus sp.]|nr:FKBP-type peptidyl-prolyl cis-trans isomerase [Cycloclasticus sp.]MBQ0790758.1 FKBP-type peptidyl-prolyl cis-trans isomerase [Cycloclasticus sp.]